MMKIYHFEKYVKGLFFIENEKEKHLILKPCMKQNCIVMKKKIEVCLGSGTFLQPFEALMKDAIIT